MLFFSTPLESLKHFFCDWPRHKLIALVAMHLPSKQQEKEI